MSMIATYRAAIFVVAAAMMNVITAMQRGAAIWKKRSPVLSACQALIKVVMTPRMYGGVVNKRVITSE